MLSIAVIGAGGHSQFHGEALKTLRDGQPDRFRLAAVCDLSEERAGAYAGKFGFGRTYALIDEMLAREKPGCVVAVTPIAKTREIAGALLGKGVPLLLEKPPGSDSGQTRELLQIAERRGTLHMVSFNRRFMPGIVRARQWLAERPGRQPKLVVARMLRHRRKEPDFPVGTGVHAVDASLSFLPPPERVDSHKMPTHYDGAFLYQARVLCRGGAAADLQIVPVVGVREESYEIHGDDFTIQIDASSGAVKKWDGNEAALDWRPPEGWSDAMLNGTVEETRAFLEGVEKGEAPPPSLRDGLASMLVAEAVLRGCAGEIAPWP